MPSYINIKILFWVCTEQGNINMIQAAMKKGVKKFVFVTSLGCGSSKDSISEQVCAQAHMCQAHRGADNKSWVGMFVCAHVFMCVFMRATGSGCTGPACLPVPTRKAAAAKQAQAARPSSSCKPL